MSVQADSTSIVLAPEISINFFNITISPLILAWWSQRTRLPVFCDDPHQSDNTPSSQNSRNSQQILILRRGEWFPRMGEADPGAD
jgi:hypothetical protein